MLSFDDEISAARAEGLVSAGAAAQLLAIERREVFSIYWELRIAAYAGVLTIIAGVGGFVAANYERIGPMAVVAGIGALAALCYFFAFKRRAEMLGSTRTAIPDYVLLLGALLVSADLAFAESQFHIFGDRWSLHLLLLAVIHGVTAYVFGSAMVLSVAITALAGWFGLEQNAGRMFHSGMEFGLRALGCAAALMIWRTIDARRPATRFTTTFDHFIANIALIGAVTWSFTEGIVLLGLLVTLTIAGLVIAWGWRSHEELFPLYGAVYGYIALSRAFVEVIPSDVLRTLWFFATAPGMVVVLFVLHRRMRSRDERETNA